jgi:beta-lactamase class C
MTGDTLSSTWTHFARLAAALLMVAVLPVTASAVPDEVATREAVDAAIRPIMTEDKVPGVAVAVTVDGKASFFNYGVASRETSAPVSTSAIFELGSVSKTFTATLALYAQELGKLSLTDHPARFMRELQGGAVDKATLLNLGTYTAGGLPLQFPDGVSDEKSIVRYFRTWKPDAEPGAQRQYSNPSIGLLGHVAAISLQSSFTSAIETGLLPRLGLNHTYIHVPSSVVADYAWGYDKDEKPVRVNPGALDAETYGVKSTTADLIRFVQINIDPSALAEPVRRAVVGTHRGYFKVGEMVQGLGWEQYPYPVSQDQLLEGNSAEIIFQPNPAKGVVEQEAGPRLLNKTGSTGGFGAYVVFVPEMRIGVVILANRNYPIPDRVRAAYAILTQLAKGTK